MMFQKFDLEAGAPELPHTTPAAAEATRLINRYPNLSEIELARLINLYRNLSALDMALMLSDEALSSKLDRFFRDQRRSVRTPFRQYAVLLGTVLLGIAVTVWAVAFGA